jgi:4-hydroxybenzoate polyprenyltransferase
VLPARSLVYLRERFPPVEYGFGASLFFFAAYATAIGLAGHRPSFSAATAVGVATFVLVFLHLRLMDEVKDAAIDERYYPERPVPRGLITLREIRLLAAGVIALELGLNATLPQGSLVPYLAVLGFTLLMYVEFFAGAALRRNFVVYTLVHMPVLPLMAGYAYALALADGRELEVLPSFALFLVLSYASGLALEIGRKLHAREDEPGGVYVRQLGWRRTAAALFALVVLGCACAVALGIALGFGPSFAAATAVPVVLTGVGVARFCAAPSPGRARTLGSIVVPTSALGPYALLGIYAVAGWAL